VEKLIGKLVFIDAIRLAADRFTTYFELINKFWVQREKGQFREKFNLTKNALFSSYVSPGRLQR
jgi:hypothetical protein